MKRGLAIVTMLVFVVVFSILAASMLALASSSTRQIESDIRRIRAFYALDAAFSEAQNRLRNGVPETGVYNIPWGIDDATGAVVATIPITVTNTASPPCSAPMLPWIAPANCLNMTVDYTSVW
ncbi:MAG: hypothetical protein ACM3L6_02710 [Deltaproteobacteria bacterium]